MSDILALAAKIGAEHGNAAAIAELRSAGLTVEWIAPEAVSEHGWVSPYSHYRSATPQHGYRAYVNLGAIARSDDAAGQASTVDRSNYRSLIRDYPESFSPTSYVNCDSLGAFLSDLTPELAGILKGLSADYPVYDEGDLSELESDEVTESWDQYLRADITSELCRVMPDEGDSWDQLGDEGQAGMFWAVISACELYPEHDGLDVRWDEAAIVAELARRLA